MRSIVLKYGAISGLIGSILMFTSVLIENKTGFGSTTTVIGYSGLVLSFIPLYFGVKAYRETVGGGYVSFLKALTVGLLIIVISALFCTISFLIIYYWVVPDYADRSSAYVLNEMRIANRPQKEIDDFTAEMVKMKEMCKNPFILAASTFPESLPMGIILSLICAGILRKKSAATQITNLN